MSYCSRDGQFLFLCFASFITDVLQVGGLSSNISVDLSKLGIQLLDC